MLLIVSLPSPWMDYAKRRVDYNFYVFYLREKEKGKRVRDSV